MPRPSSKTPFAQIPRSVRLRNRPANDSDLRAQSLSLAQELSLSPITAEILASRGIDSAGAAKSFLSPSMREQLPDPTNILNIEKAANLILDTVFAGDQITVYCDFDVDGVSSGSQLVLFLRALGAKVNIYTPNRFTEGYGLSRTGVEKLAQLGTKLLVTVDCGISNEREIGLAKRLGMKVVIIDHHQPHEIPPADVVVDPAQDGCPFQPYRMCAAGLVWMLLIVLRSQARKSGKIDEARIPDPKAFLDLAALGTVCDMVPLVGVNRLIAFRGIEALKVTTRPGLIALMQVAGISATKRLNSGHLGFGLGPRINAAGRLGDATDAIELLMTEDSRRAESLARKIDSQNSQRQLVEQEMKEACLKQLEANPEMLDWPAIALFGKEFHSGVMGIVAQRLVEMSYKPTAIMAPAESLIEGKLTPVIKGSVRSVEGFHVANVLQSLQHLLYGHGGHAEAGGFTLPYENLEQFQLAFAKAAGDCLASERTRPIVVDAETTFHPIDYKLVEEISSLAPFGVGNPSPLLVTRGVTVESASLIGESHLRLRLSDGRSSQNALAWNMQGHALLRRGEIVSIAYSPELNTYQGITSVQLNVREVWQEQN